MKKTNMATVVFILLFLAFAPTCSAVSETRYYRSNKHTVNGVTAYALGTSNSASSDTSFTYEDLFGPGIPLQCPFGGTYWKADVYRRDAGGTETLLGSNVAVLAGYYNGYQSATWGAPQTSLSSTDAIKVVEKLVGISGVVSTRTWITPQLGAVKLDAATWTFVRYCHYRCATRSFGAQWVWGLYHGSSTYNTRIEGFSYSGCGVNCDSDGTGGGRTGDGCVGTTYVDYYCSGTSCAYTSAANDPRCCTSECSPGGARRCSTSVAYQTCGNYDADSCLEWSSSSSCASGYVCSSGDCIVGTEVCSTAGDENNNGECDYDSTTCSHGDSACRVGVTGIISVTLSSSTAGSAIVVGCNSSVGGVNSINASVDGVGDCSWQSWSGSVARFSCSVGSSAGSNTVRCSVDTSKSYAVPGQESRSLTINVLPSDCSDYSSSSSCEADSRCDWCPQCVGANYTGGSDRCVDANSCPASYCWRGMCGATCDPTQGGCLGFSTCNLLTCSCVSCPPEVCSDGVDNDCDGLPDCRDPDCSTLAACSCTSPVAEVCVNGFDDDCDGLIDCVDPDCYSSSACQGCDALCAAAICKPRTEVCNNGLDDDCDGNLDCDDSDCFGNVGCCVGDSCGCPNRMTLCADGVCRAVCPVNAACNSNGICESGESCACQDCFGVRDTCKAGNVCDSDTGVCECEVGLIPCTDGSCNGSCGYCGDGIIGPGEVCDDDVFPPGIGGCEDLGFTGGTLACSDCGFDTSQCTDSVGVCGDGSRNVGEVCDGSDWGSVSGCSDLGFSGGVLDCDSGCAFDTSNCYDVPACESNGNCPPGAVCGEDGRCGCPGGTDLCSDGSCSGDCDSTDDGYKDCVNTDGFCEFGEGCHCADCGDGDRASCDISSVCIDGFCSRCQFADAYWDVMNCNADNVCPVDNGSVVGLVAEGTDACMGRSFKFGVYWKGDTGNIVGYPPSAEFGDGGAVSSWRAFWQDANPLPFFSSDPKYEFFVRAVGVDSYSSRNKIIVCMMGGVPDDDCDGVDNKGDQCPNTPFGENVETSGAYKGCSDSQIECVSQIDCSMVEWSECNANNQRTRMICKDLSGRPFFDETGECCNQQNTCRCSVELCENHGNWIPTVRECLVEEEFAVFTNLNIILVILIVAAFYVWAAHKVRRKKRSGNKKA